MNIKCCIYILLLIISSPSHSRLKVNFDEKSLVKNVPSSPRLTKLKIDLLQSKLAYKKTIDPYSFSIDGSYANSKSSEKPISALIPVTKDSSGWSLNVSRPLRYGASLSAGYSSQIFSNTSISNSATNTASLTLGLDLYKDLFGKSTNASIKEAKYSYELSKIQHKINKKVLELSVRSIFWRYVAAKESRDFANVLLASSKKQLSLVKRKKRNDVADWGDESVVLAHEVTAKLHNAVISTFFIIRP